MSTRGRSVDDFAREIDAGGGADTVFDPQPGAFLAPVLVAMIVGVLAAWVPARRATKIDAAVLLRGS